MGDAVNAIGLLILVVITAYYAIKTGQMQSDMKEHIKFIKRQVISDLIVRDIDLKLERNSQRKVCRVNCYLDNRHLARGSISQITLYMNSSTNKHRQEFSVYQIIEVGDGGLPVDKPLYIDGNSRYQMQFEFGANLEDEDFERIQELQPNLSWCLSFYDVVLGKNRSIRIPDCQYNITIPS